MYCPIYQFLDIIGEPYVEKVAQAIIIGVNLSQVLRKQQGCDYVVENLLQIHKDMEVIDKWVQEDYLTRDQKYEVYNKIIFKQANLSDQVTNLKRMLSVEYLQEKLAQQAKDEELANQQMMQFQFEDHLIQEQLEQQAQERAKCQVCLDEIELDQMLGLSNCNHGFHRNCLNEYCGRKIIEQQFPISCPLPECKREIRIDDLTEILDSQQLYDFQEKNLKQFINNNANDMSWCPTANCQYAFVHNGPYFNCPVCLKIYCLDCRIDFHTGQTCQMYRESIEKQKRDKLEQEQDQQFQTFVRGQNFKQCPNCKFWVEKNQGCDHMTCRCKYQFCYVCGGKYGECQCGKAVRRR